MTIRFPFSLPPVLQTYMESFPAEPEKTIARLEGLLKRRGNDALGYALLAFFYDAHGNNAQALALARMASVLISGNPQFNRLPFYFSHPLRFDAPLASLTVAQGTVNHEKALALSDLQSLIDDLTRPGAAKIALSPGYENDDDLSARSDADIVEFSSETMAGILENQGRLEEALVMYQKLNDPAGRFDEKIRLLKSMRNNQART